MPKTSRRDFFSSVVDGLHGAALATLLGSDLFASDLPASHIFDLTPKAPQIPAKAKSVIHLFMNGGPSQVDLFDPKPALKRLAGSAPSRELSFAISNGKEAGSLFPSPFEFKRAGKCGMEISDALPHLSERADDIALIRSMYGEPLLSKIGLKLRFPTGQPVDSYEPKLQGEKQVPPAGKSYCPRRRSRDPAAATTGSVKNADFIDFLRINGCQFARYGCGCCPRRSSASFILDSSELE